MPAKVVKIRRTLGGHYFVVKEQKGFRCWTHYAWDVSAEVDTATRKKEMVSGQRAHVTKRSARSDAVTVLRLDVSHDLDELFRLKVRRF